jgi:hypothetical protein
MPFRGKYEKGTRKRGKTRQKGLKGKEKEKGVRKIKIKS